MNNKILEWVLRIGIFGEFLGHGVFALQGKPEWLEWISQLTGASEVLAVQLLSLIGIVDIIVAFIILAKPVPIVVAWAAFWGFWTALLRPIVGEPVWDFVERWTNWAAPAALLIVVGFPKNLKAWLGLKSTEDKQTEENEQISEA